MPPQNNPYDFLSSAPSKKPSLFKFAGGSSTKQRLIQMLILVGIIAVIFCVILLVFQGAGKKDSNKLYQIAASQQDIIGLITTNSSSLRTQKLINDSATISIVITGQNADFTTYMNKHGMKSKKLITSFRNNSYKKALEEAKANGTYEKAFEALLYNRLDEYRTFLRGIYASTDNTKLKTLASNSYGQLALLSSQATN